MHSLQSKRNFIAGSSVEIYGQNWMFEKFQLKEDILLDVDRILSSTNNYAFSLGQSVPTSTWVMLLGSVRTVYLLDIPSYTERTTTNIQGEQK